MTKSKALLLIFAAFAAQMLLGIADYAMPSSGCSEAVIIPWLILRTEIFAIAAGILLKKTVGKALWALSLCAAGTLAALAAMLLCFVNGGIMFTIEIVLLAFTAPIAALYYFFTYLVVSKPQKKTVVICVEAFVTAVLSAIFFFPLTYFFNS